MYRPSRAASMPSPSLPHAGLKMASGHSSGAAPCIGRASCSQWGSVGLRQIAERASDRFGALVRRSALVCWGVLACVPLAHAGDWCGGGLWLDAMFASYYIDPDPGTHFEEFNPGLGIECWLNGQWAVTGGEFRNSLRRPSWYGGGIWAPGFSYFGWVRVAVMGGVISGYHYGNWGLGPRHTVGPVIAPIVMTSYRGVGLNIIVVPPIPSDHLPFTLGFQARLRF